MKHVGWLITLLVSVFVFLPWLLASWGLNSSLPWHSAEIWDYPGIERVVVQTLIVGLTATIASTLLASLIIYSEQRRPSKLWSLTFTAPHLAFTVACLWLFTPFGWLDRLLPIAWTWFEQQSLLTLTLLLIVKETPFLVVLGRQQLLQLPFSAWLLQGRSLGATHWHSWWLLVFPSWLRAMRLLLIAVAVYSVGVVDMALVAGPLNPPLLGPLLVSWQQQFDPVIVRLAEQGLWLLLMLTLTLMAWVYLQELLLIKWCRWQLRFVRSRQTKVRVAAVNGIVRVLRWLMFIASVASGIALLAMSAGKGWFYPALLPLQWSWSEMFAVVLRLTPQLVTTLGLALLTALLVTVLLIWTREWQRERNYNFADSIFIAALLVPQTALVLAWLHTDAVGLTTGNELSAWGITFYAHAWFAFAYAYLSYAPAERLVNQDHLTVGRSLGYSYWRSWWLFKRPELRSALAYAFLVSFLVSIAQYVPTLLLGQGYVSTLTTELVVLSSGAELQAPAVAAGLLWLIALLAIVLLGAGLKKTIRLAK